VAAGAVCLLAIERVHLVVDRNIQRVTIRSRAWWRSRRVSVPFDRIGGIGARPFAVGRQTSWNVVLELIGGGDVPLARTPLFTKESAERTAMLVRRAMQ
jgi:hypothetical protein